jgi:hypothetical protein
LDGRDFGGCGVLELAEENTMKKSDELKHDEQEAKDALAYELKQASQDAEDTLAEAWFNLRDWMAANTLNVSPQRAHIIVESKEADQAVCHWTEWHMMACELELHPEGRKLVRAVSEAGMRLENADREVHDYGVYHVFTRSFGAMLSGTGDVRRLNRTFDWLPLAVHHMRTEMLRDCSDSGTAVAYIWHGSKNFGFDDDGELQGEEPDVTLIISDELIKRNYNWEDVTIAGIMQQPFVEVG